MTAIQHEHRDLGKRQRQSIWPRLNHQTAAGRVVNRAEIIQNGCPEGTGYTHSHLERLLTHTSCDTMKIAVATATA